MKTKNHRSGFTLVELAIVLIIIGLIVGGVVGAQSLITSTKRQSVIKEINQMQQAVQAFKLEYDALPGDFDEAEDYWGSVSGDCFTDTGTGTQTCNGDSDGEIQASSSTYEHWRAFQHLSNAEILPGDFTGVGGDDTGEDECGASATSSVCLGYNRNSLPSGFGGSTSIFLMYAQGLGKDAARNVIFFANPLITSKVHPTLFNGFFNTPAFTPKDMRSIDRKADDGAPGRGAITAYIGSTSSPFNPNCATGFYVDADATYDLSQTDIECTLMADLD